MVGELGDRGDPNNDHFPFYFCGPSAHYQLLSRCVCARFVDGGYCACAPLLWVAEKGNGEEEVASS
jgi:hypothetical protein